MKRRMTRPRPDQDAHHREDGIKPGLANAFGFVEDHAPPTPGHDTEACKINGCPDCLGRRTA